MHKVLLLLFYKLSLNCMSHRDWQMEWNQCLGGMFDTRLMHRNGQRCQQHKQYKCDWQKRMYQVGMDSIRSPKPRSQGHLHM